MESSAMNERHRRRLISVATRWTPRRLKPELFTMRFMGEPPSTRRLGLNQFREQFVVCFMLLERGDERFHGLNGVKVNHGSAQFADGLDLVFREEFFLFARAAF